MKTLKTFLLFFALLVLFAGCPVWTNIHLDEYQPNMNMERIVSVGDVFFENEIYDGVVNDAGKRVFSKAFRFDLTVVEITNQKIELQYAEYLKEKSRPGGDNPYSYAPAQIDMEGAWLIKQGFTRRFGYDAADKVIHFKDYEFEIISVDKGRVRYKRIK